MTLTEFLTARLDETEATAKAAHPGPWETKEETGLFGRVAHLCVMAPFSPTLPHAATGLTSYVPLGTQDAGTARHIALHDPARVLREVEAERKILTNYERIFAERKTHPDDQAIAGALLALYGVVRTLAAVCSNHPDYNPAWSQAD